MTLSRRGQRRLRGRPEFITSYAQDMALFTTRSKWIGVLAILLIALAMLAETRTLDFFERSSFSMSSVPLLAACALLGPAGAALLAPAIAVVRGFTRRTRWQRATVDTSAYLVAGVGASTLPSQ